VILLDGVHLADLMIDHNVGAAPMTEYVLKKIDEDYFGLEDEVVGT
jgi:restriction endonuclease Mrr